MATGPVIEAVAEGLKDYPGVPVVLDPVMIAASGDPLLDPDAVDALRCVLIPLATLITPNLAEAAALLACSPARNEYEMAMQAWQLKDAGAKAVLVKGGHAEGADARSTSCSRESSLCASKRPASPPAIPMAPAARCPRPSPPSSPRALRCPKRCAAKAYVTAAIFAADTLEIGQEGRGPVHHFHDWWDDERAARSPRTSVWCCSPSPSTVRVS